MMTESTVSQHSNQGTLNESDATSTTIWRTRRSALQLDLHRINPPNIEASVL
jgi:hypothetical protein